MVSVAFRVDASPTIGSGHISRCLTLAKELLGRGARVAFAVRTDCQDYCKALETEGFLVLKMMEASPASPEQDAREFLQVVGNFGRLDWVVVDHYGLAASWEGVVRAHARGIHGPDLLHARDG